MTLAAIRPATINENNQNMSAMFPEGGRFKKIYGVGRSDWYCRGRRRRWIAAAEPAGGASRVGDVALQLKSRSGPVGSVGQKKARVRHYSDTRAGI